MATLDVVADWPVVDDDPVVQHRLHVSFRILRFLEHSAVHRFQYLRSSLKMGAHFPANSHASNAPQVLALRGERVLDYRTDQGHVFSVDRLDTAQTAILRVVRATL